jgi:mobilization protein NikA
VGRCPGPRGVRVSEPTPKAGRPRRAFAATRRKNFVVRLSDDERAQLDRLAAQKGVSVGRLLVESALSGTWDRDVREAVLTSLWRVNRLLANVTGSLNQLAHQANIAEQVVAERQLREELEALSQLRGDLTEVLREVR